MAEHEISFDFFVQLVQAIAAIRPQTASPHNKKHSTSSKNSPVTVFTYWVQELSRRHSSLPPGTALSIFRLLFPEADAERKYALQETKLSRLLAKILGVSTEPGGRGRRLITWASADKDMNASRPTSGCLGVEIQKIVEDAQTSLNADSSKHLTIKTVDALLTAVAQHCSYSSTAIKSFSFDQDFDVPSTQQAAMRRLFAQSALSPLGAATVVQIILKDLRPLLYPLPEAVAAHYTTALLGWKSNALQLLTVGQAVRVWESVMGWGGLTKLWRLRGWAAFSAFESGASEQPDLLKTPEDVDEDVEDEQDDLNSDDEPAERMNMRTTVPVVGLPVTIPKSVKGTSCKHAFQAISKHLPPSKVGAIWSETKYDGERAQIHVQRVPHGEGLNDGCWKITIYSKSGRDSTFDRAAVHEIILTALGLSACDAAPEVQGARGARVCNNAIVEAEMVAYSSTLGRIDEFWRIRSLIASTAIGPRRRAPRPRHAKNRVLPVDSQETDVDDTDSSAHEAQISMSQASMHSDSSAQGIRHLALVFFDVLHLDGVPLVDQPYKTRRATLERIVRKENGRAMLAERVCVGRAGSSPAELRRVMATTIASHEEGLVLKADEGRYGDWKIPWVKLKKDYIPGYGDCVDLVLLGAGWDKDRARELRVGPSTYTTFYIGALVDDKDSRQGDEKAHFEILFTTAYGLSREKLEELNFVVRNSGKGYVECAGKKHPISELPYTYRLYDGILRPGPTMMLATPLLVEVMGAGFTKEPRSQYYTLRFSRIEKVHRPSERSWSSGVSLGELQNIARSAIGRDRPGKAEDDWVSELWGTASSPRARAPERQRDEEELWFGRLECADGLSASNRYEAKIGNPLKRKRVDRDGLEARDSDSDEQLGRRVRPNMTRLAEFVQGSSEDVVRRKEMREQETVPTHQVQIFPKTPLSSRVLGSVTNLIQTSPETPTRIAPAAGLLTDMPTSPRPWKDSFIAASAAPRIDLNEDVSGIMCEEEVPIVLDPVYQALPTPPSTALSRGNVRSSPTAPLAYCTPTSLQAFLSNAVVWLARPNDTAVPSWHADANYDTPSIPLQNQVHTLDALLFACGWSGFSMCAWAGHGVVFVDATPSQVASSAAWSDPRYPLRLLMDRRNSLLNDSASSARSKPIWVFSKDVLIAPEADTLSCFQPEKRAICKLG